MVNFNSRVGQNYQVNLQKSKPKPQTNQSQQTTQEQSDSSLKASKNQEPLAQIPLSNLQFIAGVRPKSDTGDILLGRHIGTTPDDDSKVRNWLINNNAQAGDTLKIRGNVYIVKSVFLDEKGETRYQLERLND